jgi:hypothetical protein
MSGYNAGARFFHQFFEASAAQIPEHEPWCGMRIRWQPLLDLRIDATRDDEQVG